jgi:hypothetical protein
MNAWRVALGLIVAVSLSLPIVARAESAPAGATGLCKDGSYTTSASKRGACRGHGGVTKWLAGAAGSSGEPAAPKATKAKSKAKETPTAAASAASTPPAGATGQCKDGSYTTSATKRGACRGHGGVSTWLAAKPAGSSGAEPATAKEPKAKTRAKAKEAAPAPAPAPAEAAAPTPAPAAAPVGKPRATSIPSGTQPGAPEGATALCKDGSYSMSKQHGGACSHHGGVAKWLE